MRWQTRYRNPALNFCHRLISRLTPGITRPLLPLIEFDNMRVAGRVHAVVSHRGILFQPCQAIGLGLISSANLRASSNDRQVLER